MNVVNYLKFYLFILNLNVTLTTCLCQMKAIIHYPILNDYQLFSF